ncbi:MAG: AAA family ATPase [Bacteroidota bacterium]
MNKAIYVAATGQHVGKTTSTLGLIAALKSLDLDGVGYCKPVGQEITELDNLKVDKDAFLFSEIMQFKLASEIHSPVILGRGATTAFLDHPDRYPFAQNIKEAAEFLHSNNQVVVYEGTGHPGVGSIVGLSNADVAKMLDAKVVVVVEGGIGNTIDKLNMSLAMFREQKVPIIGIIVNKVLPQKMDKVRHYVDKKLKMMGLDLLGILPYEKSMSNPIMQTVTRAVKGRVLYNGQKLANRVEQIIPGSLIEEVPKISKQQNLLLVVSYKRAEDALKKIEALTDFSDQHSPLSGILLTGEGRLESPSETYPLYMDYVRKFRLPVISTHLDTLGAFTKINQIEVKINTSTPWKVERAIQLIKENVDLKLILGAYAKNR